MSGYESLDRGKKGSLSEDIRPIDRKSGGSALGQAIEPIDRGREGGEEASLTEYRGRR